MVAPTECERVAAAAATIAFGIIISQRVDQIRRSGRSRIRVATVASAPLAGYFKRFDTLWRRRQSTLTLRFAGERDRRCRQNFPFSYKPMLIGLPVHAAIFTPDLVSALANAFFPGSDPCESSSLRVMLDYLSPPWLPNGELSTRLTDFVEINRRRSRPHMSFPEIRSGRIRAVTENQSLV